MVNLKYSTFVDSLVATFPEIKGKYDLVQEDIGPDILPYMAVELILEPFAKDLLEAKAAPELRRQVFAFLEEMAQSQDIEVVNLLHVGIFESWAADSETLARAWKFMGEGTKRVARDAAHRMNRGHNLPRVVSG